jgi:uncharacterized membrane protein YkvA (DUF1232 family)
VKISFELSKKDLMYFRDRLASVKGSGGALNERRVIRSAGRMVTDAAESDPPEFVSERIAKLARLIEMLSDSEWGLKEEDRTQILYALAYFVDPDDMIPDRVPVIGYLDDAIMIELVVRELKHEIEAYEDFCSFRENNRDTEGEADRLAAKSIALLARMGRRRRKDRKIRRASSSARGSRPALRLW